MQVARTGDGIGHGVVEGVIIGGSSTVFVEGQAVARIGDAVICHHPIGGGGEHGAQTIVGGSSDLFAQGPRVARVGDGISCGATIQTGASRTFVD